MVACHSLIFFDVMMYFLLEDEKLSLNMMNKQGESACIANYKTV